MKYSLKEKRVIERNGITDNINSVWNSNKKEGDLNLHDIIYDYNCIVININEFALKYGKVVAINKIVKNYDKFIYQIFNLNRSRYTPVFDNGKLSWLQFSTRITGGDNKKSLRIFVNNDRELTSHTNKFIECIIEYFGELSTIREQIESFKEKYSNKFNKLDEKTMGKMKSVLDTYYDYTEKDSFNERIAIVFKEFDPLDIKFYTLKEGKYYEIRIKTDKIIKDITDLCDNQIEYTYTIHVSDLTKEEAENNRNISKMHNNIAKLEEN